MNKLQKSKIRAKRTRAKLGKSRPRLSVFVSNSHIYAQIIDDKTGRTLVSVSDKDAGMAGKTIEIARKTGEILGEKAKAQKVKEVVFDRGSKRYHGRIKAFSEGARKELSF